MGVRLWFHSADDAGVQVMSRDRNGLRLDQLSEPTGVIGVMVGDDDHREVVETQAQGFESPFDEGQAAARPGVYKEKPTLRDDHGYPSAQSTNLKYVGCNGDRTTELQRSLWLLSSRADVRS